jgi:hypothetical protein
MKEPAEEGAKLTALEVSVQCVTRMLQNKVLFTLDPLPRQIIYLSFSSLPTSILKYTALHGFKGRIRAGAIRRGHYRQST